MKVVWHAALAIFYVLQAIAILLFLDVGLERSLDITFLSHNLFTDDLATTVRTVYTLQISHALAGILTLTAVWHLIFIIGTKLRRYIVEQKINVWRWLLGGLLLGTIAALTALVLGNSELSYLLLLIVIGLACGWLGLLREYLVAQESRQGNSNRAASQLFWQIATRLVFSLQRAGLIIPWLLIAISAVASYFWARESVVAEYYFVFAAGFLLVLAWLLNTVLASRQFAQWRNYDFVDKAYFVAHGIFFSAWIWIIVSLGV